MVPSFAEFRLVINHMIFKYPIDVVNNLFLVTEYMRKQIAREGGDPERETLTFLRTKDENQLLQTDDGGYFRLYRMIDRGVEMQKPRTPAEAFEAAAAIGKFQHELIGFPAEQLSVTFPEMHNMKKRIRTLLDAYRTVTGEEGFCRSTGGGTYVHDLKNGVAFGASMPKTDNRMHAADEFAEISDLTQAAKIYAVAIAELCK